MIAILDLTRPWSQPVPVPRGWDPFKYAREQLDLTATEGFAVINAPGARRIERLLSEGDVT